MMSQENVEIVREIYEALARHDPASVLARYDPTVEFHFSRGTVAEHYGTQGIYRGHAGLREFDAELRDAFTSFETNAEELIEAGEQVISASRYHGQGRGSGVEVAGPIQFGVWTIRDGLITRVEWFATRAEADAAVGVSG